MSLIPKSVRQQVCSRAQNCCEYCKTQQILIGMPLVVDHIMPSSIGGDDAIENLAAACYRCNQFKGARTSAIDPLSQKNVLLFNPRCQKWSEHFSWIEQGLRIAGKTEIGRATAVTLRLNNPYVTESRKIWISENWHPPMFP